MRVSVFFVCLFFLLLKGHDYFHAGPHYDSWAYTHAQDIAKSQQFKSLKFNSTKTKHRKTVSRDIYPDQKKDFFVFDDVKDDNSNILLDRKFTELADCYLALSHLFILRHLYTRYKAHSDFSGPFAYKYITQRVLRI
jgi:hypothetical protein